MVIDPVCSIVFEAEPEEEDVMRRPPRDPASPIFNRSIVVWSLLQGAFVLALVAAVFVNALGRGLPDDEARALAFTTLVATNIGLLFVNRSFSASMLDATRTRRCGGSSVRRQQSSPACSCFSPRASCSGSDRSIGTTRA
jgi:Ca2+-transporting ATPase